jgi:hypothetical protein
MISINIFEVVGNPESHTAAYNWPDQPLPAGRLIGQQGNALLMELANGNGVAVISAPRASITFADEGLPVVDLDWAFRWILWAMPV